MKKIIYFCICVNLIFLLGCSPKYIKEVYSQEVSWQPYLDSWKGKTENEIIKEFGAPNNSYTTNSGISVLKYTSQKTYHGNSVTIGGMIFNNAFVSQYYIEFYLNRNGIVDSISAYLPPKYEQRTRTARQDNSELWFYGFMGLLSIATIVAVALIGI